MSDEKAPEPRRFKLPSELDDDERATTTRFGAAGRRFERDEYKRWRRGVLRDERDDLELRARLLDEEAETLRTRAADTASDAREEVGVEGWIAREQAKNEGRELEPIDGGASGFEDDAVELEREAQEIRQHLVDIKEPLDA